MSIKVELYLSKPKFSGLSAPPSHSRNFQPKLVLLRFKCSRTPNVYQSRIISIKAEIFKQNWYYCDLSVQRLQMSIIISIKAENFKQNWYYCDLNAKRLQMSIKVELYLSNPKFSGLSGPPP